MAKRVGDDIWGRDKPRKYIASTLSLARKLNKNAAKTGSRHLVFVNSMADFFECDTGQPIIDHNGNRLYWTPDGAIAEEQKPTGEHRKVLTLTDLRARAFELFDECNNLTFLLLTKRPENIGRMWPCVGLPDAGVPGTLGRRLRLEKVWIGTTAENQEYANKRIPELLKCREFTPVLFLSCEPLLGAVDLRNVQVATSDWTKGPNGTADDMLDCLAGETCSGETGCVVSEDGPTIDWVIAGGESGPNARPSHPDWFRGLRDQCDAVGVPFHFKQWGEWYPLHGTGMVRTDEDTEHKPFVWMTDAGKTSSSGSEPDRVMLRVGKDRAGRLLDGAVHDALPEVRS